MDNKQAEIQIKINEETFKGVYANGSIISHTQSEFIMDFVSIFHNKGILCSRVIVSPQHAKRLQKIINENIAMYEKSFGTIKEAEAVNINMDTAH